MTLSETDPTREPYSVLTFEARCNDCEWRFPCPLLGPGAYGEFVAVGSKGSVYAYLNSLEGLGWAAVDHAFKQAASSLIQRMFGPSSRSSCFQWVVGRCLDTLQDQRLSIVSGPICPKCLSQAVRYGDAHPLAPIALPRASFAGFLQLNPAGRVSQVRALRSEWQATARAGTV